MEGDNNQYNSGNNPKKPIQNANSRIQNISNPANQHIGRKPTKSITNKEKDRDIIVNVFNSENENSEAITANVLSKESNKVSWLLLFINIAGIIFTGTIAWIAISQSKSAIKAATITDSTFKETKRYNDSSLAIQKLAFNSSNTDAIKREKREVERSKRESISLGAQIKSIKITQSQFENEHAPLLQINFTGENIGANRLKLNYTLFNLTTIPIKVITLTSACIINVIDSFKIPNLKFEKFEKEDITFNNYYVIKETPQPRVTYFNYKSDKQRIGYFEKGYLYLRVKGEITYVNLVTNKKRKYSYIVKLTYEKSNPPYQEFIYNENYNNKKTSVN